MTNQILESAPVVSPVTTPTAPGGVTGGQPPSNGPVTFTPEQQAEIDARIERGVQSWKDRRIVELENKLSALQPVPTPASLVQSPQAQAPSSANGVTQAAQPTVEYESVIQMFGLDPNDREVWRLAGQHQNEKDFTYALAQLKKTRATQAPPSPAAVAPSPTGGVAPSGKLDISNIKDPGKLYDLARQEGTKLPGRNS